MKTFFRICIAFWSAMLTCTVQTSFAQSDMNQPYQAEWKELEAFEAKNRPRSAMEVAEKIYAKAKEEANHSHWLAALDKIFTYQTTLEEKSDSLIYERIKQELFWAPEPAKQILHTMMADYLRGQLEMRRYELYDREQLEEETEDIDTWSLPKFHKEIDTYFQASLENAELLRNTPIREFEFILNTHEESPRFRPSLYDLMAHRYIEFLLNEDVYLTVSKDTRRLQAQDWLIRQDEFLKKDTEGEQREIKLMATFQELISFHQKRVKAREDNAQYALTDVELARLKYLRSHSVGEDKDTVYLELLEAWGNEFPNHVSTAEVNYEIAKLYQQRAGNYDPFGKTQYRWDSKRAREIAASQLEKFPGSTGAKKCRQLILQIENKALEIINEKSVLPEQAFRLRVQAKNVKQIYFRVIDYKESYFEARRTEQIANRLRRQNPIYSWSEELKAMDDYQSHSTEVKVDGLKLGKYVILASDNADFIIEGHAVAYTLVQSTELSAWYRSQVEPDGQKLTAYVMERKEGEPLKDVKVQPQSFDYRRDRYQDLGSWRPTNKEGKVELELPADIRQIRLSITSGKDNYTTENVYSGYRYRPDPENRKVFFYTDRSIYRPGQTIYFKAVVLNKQEKEYQILTNESIEVSLYDANWQEVTKLDLTTNEFGSVTGSFVAPLDGLRGNFTLQAQGGSQGISVEEYKRPTFEVIFESLEGTYELGDQVTASGKAMAYAGSAISQATVKYRVVREARLPFWWYWRRGGARQSPSQEIANGEVTTDNEGKFDIDFELIPDEKLDPSSQAIFTYRIYADVVDISGETRSGQQYVRAGYVPLQLGLTLGERISMRSPGNLIVSTTNLSGEKVEAKGAVNIFKLDGPYELLRKRRWERVDQHLLSDAEYRKLFPHDLYANEDQPQSWKELSSVWEQNFNTGDSDTLKLDDLNEVEPGWYKVVVKLDEYELEEVRWIEVFDPKAKTAIKGTWLSAELDKNQAEPGDKVTLSLSSSVRDVWVLYQLEQNGEAIDEQMIRIKKKKAEIEIPILEAYRGNVNINLHMVRHNDYRDQNLAISVPWTNKELKLSWSTLRSKLQPGQEENWKLTISGSKAEKVAAEMVATLYDASLDVFRPHSYYLSLYPYYGSSSRWYGGNDFSISRGNLLSEEWNKGYEYIAPRGYDELKLSAYVSSLSSGFGGRVYAMQAMSRSSGGALEDMRMREEAEEAPMASPAKSKKASASLRNASLDLFEQDEYSDSDSYEDEPLTEAANPKAEGSTSSDAGQIPIRTNLNETAFFFPQLTTNESGEIELNFTIPEALTRWKLLGLAHTKDLKIGTITGETVTQKDVMVQPNLPRFFRENDQITLTAKVSNLSEEDLNGTAYIQLLDAFNMQPIEADFGVNSKEQDFTIASMQNTVVKWDLKINGNTDAVIVRISAKAGDFTDGEEHVLPVLKNSMLVTESIPLTVRGNEKKDFTFQKLAANESETLKHRGLTLEFTSNPAWYAVQALPYLMEYPHECTEQIFSRFYANALASHIASSSPRIQQIFDQWRTSTGGQGQVDNLISNLEKNQELKAVLLEETPWVLNAKDENERKKRVGLLFDLNRMADEFSRARNQLAERQHDDGSFPWFPGMRSSRYITQLMATGFGHLQKLGVSASGNPEVASMMQKAVPYLDRMLAKDLEDLKRNKVDLEKDHLGYTQIQYLYMRSFFRDLPYANGTQNAVDYFMKQAQQYWPEKGPYMQGMLTLVFHRNELDKDAGEILTGLEETSIRDEELGMYWKMNGGYYWYQAPIETQSLLIEAFAEAGKKPELVEEMKIWLLKNKQTNDWESTRATVAACNALLGTGRELLKDAGQVAITVGEETIDPAKRSDISQEAGTGYFKTVWAANEVKPEMGQVTVEKKDEGIAWGALYWQYFEQLDKITYAATPLSLQKKLYIERMGDNGPVLSAVEDNNNIQVGDKVIVRIELRVDRDMEYVHLKDMRAAGFEPMNVLSGYRWKGGLGYYESTRDAATNFFFEYLPKGTHVFEYPLRATLSGDFSNGVASIQCMYAPEFTSHSEGIRVEIR